MEWNYSEELNVQILVSLLKAHNIRRVIVSPGSTNVCLVASLQSDPYFEIYSCVDERSAAYMACGIAEETGEPVVLSCTGATASRNYMPALTEAYYRRLPLVAITSSQINERIGHLIPQVTDRRVLPNDVALLSVQVPVVKMNDEIWNCSIQVNKALTECRRRGGGPVHINLQTRYSRNFNVKELPKVNVIERIGYRDKFPSLPQGKVVIFIGSHRNFTQEETEAVDRFCSFNDAVVFYEISSGYNGHYGIKYDLIAAQQYSNSPLKQMDLLIQIGELAGADFFSSLNPKEVWRVNNDGEIKDTFKKLRYVFEMDEVSFFEHYYNKDDAATMKRSQFDIYTKASNDLMKKLEDSNLPFSNIWIAVKSVGILPKNSEIHVGIMNSFRAWNLVKLPDGVRSYCNVGGYGIDGCMSSMIGASLVHSDRLYFGVFGDLAFFYDMNILGNHHIKNNVRIMLVNNGKGNEFHNYIQVWAQFGNYADEFGAAGGHFGCKSSKLVKHYAEDLGFEYMTASDKESFQSVLPRFVIPEMTDKPMLFEVFTNGEDESEAYKIMRRLVVDIKEEIKGKAIDSVRKAIGDTTARKIADMMNIR